MARSEIVFRSRKGRPCRCCQSETKGCSCTRDDLVFCRGTPSDGWKVISTTENGFHCCRQVSQQPPDLRQREPSDWELRALAYSAALTRRHQQLLCNSLGIPIEALSVLPLIGFTTKYRGAITFPERDGLGEIIGISTRTFKGKKLAIKGSKRGLTLIPGWEKMDDPLFLVEGVSDVLAMTYSGNCSLGRPSNVGGVQFLKIALQNIPLDRHIIVVAENDQKASGEWPGAEGAMKVGRQLTQALNRPICYAIPPVGFKDCRAWLTDSSNKEKSWQSRGAELRRLLAESTIVIELDDNLREDGEDREDGSSLPEIEINTKEHEVNEQATAAMQSLGTVYQRGGILLQVYKPLEFRNSESPRRPKTSVVVRELIAPLLREHLTRCAKWVKEKNDKLVSVHPPGWSINAILSRGRWPNISILEAVLDHPVILENGTVLDKNGYDPSSGLLVDLPSDLQVEVPEKPNQVQAVEAAKSLLDLVVDFQFATAAHRSAWVAGLLTPLAWFAFEGPAPLFLIDGNTRGVGKGLLADVIGLSLTGKRLPVTNYTNEKEELRKKVTSLVVAGDRLVLLDNLVGMVGNDVLDSVLTSTHWKDRLLGGNRIYDGPIHICWFGTGNNVQLDRDTPRRVLPIRVETMDENPELRKDFRYPELRKHVRSHRSSILQAALTILKAWMQAGKPLHGLVPWGSFEGWSNCIREAIVFAGLPDPGLARASINVSTDRNAVCMTAILKSLENHEHIQDGLTTAEIVKLVHDPDSRAEWHSDLKAAVSDLCSKVDVKSVSYRFRELQNRNFGGRVLTKTDPHQGYARWTVRKIDEFQTGRKHPHDDHHPHEGLAPPPRSHERREVLEL